MPPLMHAIGVLMAVLIGSLTLGAQTDDALVRVLDVKRSAMPQEITRLGNGGYDLALARLDPGLVIAQKGRAPGTRSYLFVEDVGTFLASKRLEPGYRLLPQTFSPGGKPYCAVFERAEGDDRLREYAIVAGSSPGDLEKKAQTQLGEGFVPVAINTEDAAVAIFERRSGVGPWKLLSTRRTKTMEEELSAAASEGYRIAAASGGVELVFALVRPLDAQPVEYRLLSTTRSVTLERELNEAAAQGWRFVPGSLAALQASSTMFGGRAAHEAAIVIEKVPAEAPVTYRIVGARRVATVEKEALEPASQGFGIVAALLGYEETVVILASPREATTTFR